MSFKILLPHSALLQGDMSLLTQRFLNSISPLTKQTTIKFQPLLSLLYSSIPSNLDETHVLNQLSNLLPISPDSNQSAIRQKNAQKLVTGFLKAEERLRGVFLQKLKGKFAIECALTNVGVDLSLDIVANVLNRGSLGGEAMITFFNWAIKHPGIPNDASSYNVLIRALGRRKYVDLVVRVLMDLRAEGARFDIETLEIVMDSMIRARRVYKAIQMFGTCEEFGFERCTESLNVLLRCLCRRAHVGAANWYLNSVKGKVVFNLMTYNVVVGGWSRLGRVAEIERLLEAMMDDGFDPDCLTYSYILEGLGRAGRIEDAVKIFDEMEDKGCSPDITVYNAMIKNFVSVGDFDESKKYYGRLLSDSCDPNINTYLHLISAFIKARKVSDALEIFDEMMHRGIFPMTGAITQFIEPLCSFGPPHAAMMLYKKARKGGCKVSLSAYKLLLMRLSRFGKCGMMLNVWDDMQECGHSSDIEVYEYIINGFCNVGKLENAIEMMEELLRKGFCPSKLIYSKLNNKLLASNNIERAYKLFLKIKNARRDDNARRFWRSNGWHF